MMHKIEYIYQRRDFVAVTRALIRRPFWITALKLLLAALIVGHVFIIDAVVGADAEFSLAYLNSYFDFLPLWVFLLFIIGFGDGLAGLVAAFVFKKNASANKSIRVELHENGIHASSEDIRSEIGWKSIVKVIETNGYLFLALSKREALALPKRAFSSEADFAEALRFVGKHVSPQTPMVKHQRFRILPLKTP